MPEARQELRDKFLKRDANTNQCDDGIETCEIIIENAGLFIDENWMICVPVNGTFTEELWDAIEYLKDEWDYGVKFLDMPEFNELAKK